MSLARELNMSRPFSSVQEEALLSIFTTYDLLYQGLCQTLRDHGITLAQYNVLRILRGAGGEGLPLMSIARRMIVRYPNITRLTDRLESDGLIRRERCTEDRRVVRGYVTDRGLELLAGLDGRISACTRRLMKGATPEGLRSLIGILESVRMPLREADPRPSPNGKSDGER